jgi:oligopeptide/dipeptide ABC transporter ATP-binding protein
MNDDVVLSVRGLETRFYGREVVTAVRDVSFDVGRGEKLAIVGESGCGKSALALSILGLIEPPGRIVGGEVWLNGRDVSGLDDRELSRVRGREISLIFQDPMSALDPVKTIGHQIMESVVRHQPKLGRKGARARAVELLREVEVPSAERRLDDYPHQYSGGMRQRVVIAMALALRPTLLIADEPTTALDVTIQQQILGLVAELQRELGMTTIWVTHDLGVVARLVERVVVMYGGHVVEDAPVREIFAAPQHPYTARLLASLPNPADDSRPPLVQIPGRPPLPTEHVEGCPFRPRCPQARDVCGQRPPLLDRGAGRAACWVPVQEWT